MMNEQTLWHYAANPVKLEKRGYTQPTPAAFTKPKGLWVSVAGDDDWPAWCNAEDFYVRRLVCRHAVFLEPDAKVLWLSTADEVLSFDDRFGVKCGPDADFYKYCIDWTKVASEHDGIIIAPYQWALRLDLSWYYTWDCASGCIWNLDAIKDFVSAPASARVSQE